MGRTVSGARLLTLLVVFGLLGCGLVVRLGYWQISQRDQLVSYAHGQIYIRTEVPSKRGSIYDRSGTVVLASSLTRDRLVVSAERMTDAAKDRLTAFLAGILTFDAAGAADIRAKLATGKPYVILARDLAPEQSEAIRQAADAEGITGLTFEATSVRQYPQTGGGAGMSLGAQLIGFVNQAGTGQYGVEQFYQSTLAGKPSVIEFDKDANGQPLADTERVAEPGVPGEDLRLSIDGGLQLAMEQEVMAAKIADGAASASAIVMDPYTGAIYGEATYPGYDANNYSATAADDPSRFLDPIVSDVYEPGSVFKLFTVIAGLETGTTTLAAKYRDTGSLSLDGGRTKVLDADRRGMGTLKLADAIAYSRNVVAAKVALGLGPTTADAAATLHEVWTRMGFGSLTGIDVSGEVRGLVNDPAISAWRQIDLANGAFGQGVAITPIQLATAYAAMVNGGTLVQPHVVAAIGNQPVQAPSRGTVLDASMSPVLANLMNHVLSIPWYKALTTVPGYWLGAKTGTAQIWDAVHHRWYANLYNFSAVGFIGRTTGHPDLVVAVQIHSGRPNRNAIGQLILPVASYELFRRIATDAITIPGLLPAAPAEEGPIARVGG